MKFQNKLYNKVGRVLTCYIVCGYIVLFSECCLCLSVLVLCPHSRVPVDVGCYQVKQCPQAAGDTENKAPVRNEDTLFTIYWITIYRIFK